MNQQRVPATTVHRLLLYLRCLLRAQQQRVAVMNSVAIAEMAGSNAAQVRKDLSYLGEYGTRGIGYDVDELTAHLSRWLGITEERRAAIIGFGRLGPGSLGRPACGHHELHRLFDGLAPALGLLHQWFSLGSGQLLDEFDDVCPCAELGG